MPVALQDSDLVATIELTDAAWQELPLGDARIIVSGGRGIGGEDGFVQLKELAVTLDATVAASRSAVEFGWADRHRMVDVAGTLSIPICTSPWASRAHFRTAWPRAEHAVW